MPETTTLETARETLRDSVLYLGNETYSDNRKLDRAIRVACQRFLRETGMSRTVGTVDTVADTQTLDINATLSDFLAGALISPPWIEADDTSLRVVSMDDIRYKRAESSASDSPEFIAFLTPTVAHLYPTPDAVYTISLYYHKPLISFTVGTGNPAGTTLNVDDRYIDEVLWTGAAGYLLIGARHTHKDADGKMREFDLLIRRAKGELTPPFTWDSTKGPVNESYNHSGRI